MNFFEGLPTADLQKRLRAESRRYSMTFYEPAETSRGTLTQKTSFFLKLYFDDRPETFGLGECSILPGLSMENESTAAEILGHISSEPAFFATNLPNKLKRFPGVRFAFETALVDLLNGGKRILFPSDFTAGKVSIPTNSLIWMGSAEHMRGQIDRALAAGTPCIKLKVGSLDFTLECELLAYIRKAVSADQVTICLDANGAFLPDDALAKIDRLAEFDIDSLEQPIKAGQPAAMAEIVRHATIPVALDEELIGAYSFAEKEQLLRTILPPLLVLKPGLNGGFAESSEWIEIARRLNINWKITSALESNIGLNAIAQWSYQNCSYLPQGLGTGKLFTNNIPSGIHFSRQGKLRFLPVKNSRYLVPAKVRRLFSGKVVTENTNSIRLRPGFQEEPMFRQKILQWAADANQPAYLREFAQLAQNWLDAESHISMKTSGSTGTPTILSINKQYALRSARRTLDFLGLGQGGTFLLALSPAYIAGMMMFVRAVAANAGLMLVSPEPAGLRRVQGRFDLGAFVPYQVKRTPRTAALCRFALIGGSKLVSLPEQLKQHSQTVCFETFGMTETISHIALRNLSAGETDFALLPHVSAGSLENRQMWIHAPEIGIEKLVSNDLVEMTGERTFRWLGRLDDVINIAGNKIYIGQIEEKLSSTMPCPFIITKLRHPERGEIPAIIAQSPHSQMSCVWQAIQSAAKNLKKYEIPQCIAFTDQALFDGRGKRSHASKHIDPAAFIPLKP